MHPTAPSIIVIFGITGDLAQRYLLPALYHLFKDDLLDERTVILGVTRGDVSAEALLGQVELCVNELDNVCDPVALKKVQRALRMHQMNLTEAADYRQLLAVLNTIEAEQGVCMNRLYYLSIPPQMFEPIVRNLGEQGLNKSCAHGTAATRLLIEKPFGYDLASARELIEETAVWFEEDQIFRIDHYLAKDMVQHIVSFRKEHSFVEKIWNNEHIAGIQITAFEKLDIEGRATFYEEVGALRDFIQSHLLQILAIVAMDMPDKLESDTMHNNRLLLLDAIKPITPPDVSSKTIRAQYEGYRKEVGNDRTVTETFAAVYPTIASSRWDGVSVVLQTGKAMAERRADVRILFAPENEAGELIFRIQPDPKIIVNPGKKQLEFFTELAAAADAYNKKLADDTPHPDAYEHVLLDAIRGDHTLFTSSEEVIAAWQVVSDVVSTWGRDDDGLKFYPKGAAQPS